MVAVERPRDRGRPARDRGFRSAAGRCPHCSPRHRRSQARADGPDGRPALAGRDRHTGSRPRSVDRSGAVRPAARKAVDAGRPHDLCGQGRHARRGPPGLRRAGGRQGAIRGSPRHHGSADAVGARRNDRAAAGNDDRGGATLLGHGRPLDRLPLAADRGSRAPLRKRHDAGQRLARVPVSHRRHVCGHQRSAVRGSRIGTVHRDADDRRGIHVAGIRRRSRGAGHALARRAPRMDADRTRAAGRSRDLAQGPARPADIRFRGLGQGARPEGAVGGIGHEAVRTVSRPACQRQRHRPPPGRSPAVRTRGARARTRAPATRWNLGARDGPGRPPGGRRPLQVPAGTRRQHRCPAGDAPKRHHARLRRSRPRLRRSPRPHPVGRCPCRSRQPRAFLAAPALQRARDRRPGADGHAPVVRRPAQGSCGGVSRRHGRRRGRTAGPRRPFRRALPDADAEGHRHRTAHCALVPRGARGIFGHEGRGAARPRLFRARRAARLHRWAVAARCRLVADRQHARISAGNARPAGTGQAALPRPAVGRRTRFGSRRRTLARRCPRRDPGCRARVPILERHAARRSARPHATDGAEPCRPAPAGPANHRCRRHRTGRRPQRPAQRRPAASGSCR